MIAGSPVLVVGEFDDGGEESPTANHANQPRACRSEFPSCNFCVLGGKWFWVWRYDMRHTESHFSGGEDFSVLSREFPVGVSNPVPNGFVLDFS
jgi:hypothetical protein